MKSTKISWQVSGVRHKGDLRIGPNTRLHMVGPDEDAVCAVFYDMQTGRGWKEAKLISAAPEMLEALHEANAHFGPFADITVNGAHDPQDVRVVSAIRAAIAKANGVA